MWLATVWRDALHLIRSGVAGVNAVDKAMRAGFALDRHAEGNRQTALGSQTVVRNRNRTLVVMRHDMTVVFPVPDFPPPLFNRGHFSAR